MLNKSLLSFLSSLHDSTPNKLEKLYKAESFLIRNGIKTASSKEKPTMILKTLILNLGGVNTDWIQIEVVSLLSSSDLIVKKIAYLCAAVLLDITAEISVLVTQALINDLQSSNLQHVILALIFLANLNNFEICNSVAPIIEKLLNHSNQCILMHAAAAALTIIRISPEFAENFQSAIPNLLQSDSHSTLMTGLYLAKAIVSSLPSTHSFKKSLIPASHYLIKLLKSQITARSTKQYHYGYYQDPFLIINILSYLGVMNFHSDSIFEAITSSINSVRPTSCTGRAILFAAADTITSFFPHFHKKPKISSNKQSNPSPTTSSTVDSTATNATTNSQNSSTSPSKNNNTDLLFDDNLFIDPLNDEQNSSQAQNNNNNDNNNLEKSTPESNGGNNNNDNTSDQIQVTTGENKAPEKREIASIMAFAQNQVCKLLATKNHPNTLYSGLSALTKILYNGSEIRERHSADSIVIARYKDSIADLLVHQDPSIRKRALDVIVALVDETNVETLVPELLEHLSIADKDFKGEMIEKTFWAIQRFAPSDFWSFQITEMLIIDSGPYIDGNMIRTFIYLVTNDEEVKNAALPGFLNLLSSYEDNQPLIQASSFCIGEYFQYSASKISEISNFIREMLKISLLSSTTSQTIGYLLTATAKLIARFNIFNNPNTTELAEYCKNVFQQHQESRNLDVQQRAGELIRFISSPDCDSIFAPFPPTEDPAKKAANAKSRRRKSSYEVENSGILFNKNNFTKTTKSSNNLPNNPKNNNNNLLIDLLDLSNSTNNNNNLTTNNNNIQLLDLGDLLTSPAPSTNNNNNNNNNQTNSLAKENPVQINQNTSNNNTTNKQIPSIPGAKEAVRTQDYVVWFEVKRNESNPNQIAIRVNTFGLSQTPLTKFKMQYGVPTGWKVVAKQQSGDVLDFNTQKSIQQVIMLENSGSSKLQMKLLCSYMFGSQPLKTVNSVNPIFD